MSNITIPDTLIKAYKIEYESSDISLDALFAKYGLEEGCIDTSEWIKKYEEVEKDPVEVDVIEDTDLPIDNKEVSTATNHQQKLINDCKKAAIELAHEFFTNFDPAINSVKDFKDMVAAVDSIDKSYKNDKSDDKLNINIVMQNVIEKFKDDC